MHKRRFILIMSLVMLTVVSTTSGFRGGHMRGGGHHGGGHHGGFGHHGGSGHHGGGHGHHGGHHHASHHHAAHHHHAHHAFHHAVHIASHVVIGAYILSRPRYSTVVYVNASPYYYSAGTYYVKKSDSVYVTVPPPTGAEITSLPDGTVPIQFDGTSYSYYLGTFYLKSGNQYQVATAPVGATVTYAPKGAKRKTVNGVGYFVYGGVYYKPKFVDGLTLYSVAANPTTAPAQANILLEPPAGNIAVQHDGTDYYYLDGKWYEEVTGGYEMTAAPAGASVPYLPETAQQNGNNFVVDNTTYKPYQKSGVTLYRVVG